MLNRSECFEAVIRGIRERTNPESAEAVRAQAQVLVENAIESYSKAFGGDDVGFNSTGMVSTPFIGAAVAAGTNGLMYGRVQSGKTNASIASVALASAYGFRCFVVLTSDNTWLGKQTADRFRDQLGAGAGPIVKNWLDWKRDPEAFAKTIRSYMDDTGVVLVTTKNTKNLEYLETVLHKSGANRVPGLFLDDEADNASLNTNTAAIARGKKVDVSKIFGQIGALRKIVPNHIFVQITATPQSLLLQGLDHPLRPAWHVMVEPGSDYVGGRIFFAESSSYLVHVDDQELASLRAGRIRPGNSWEIPEGLAKATCCFLVGAAHEYFKHGRSAVLSMLIHIDHKKISHETVQEALQKYLLQLDKSLRDKLSNSRRSEAERQLTWAHTELARTEENLPPITSVVEWLQRTLRNADPEVINADNPNRRPEYRVGMNFLIGGNRLGRGVTIEGLTTTYYGRDAKSKMMDTVHQHARMFGYRKHLLPITRVFSAEHILGALKDIYESDEGTRNVIEADGALAAKPVWVGPRLRPTRANVLNPADIDAVVGGRAIWPPELIVSPSKIAAKFAKLESRLAAFTDRDDYYEISIDEMREILKLMPSNRVVTRTWDDERIQQMLEIVEGNPFNLKSGFVNVRRGRGANTSGFDVDYETQQISGFAEGTQINEAKRRFGGSPVLLLRKQKGDKEKHWKGHPFYAPTLILPGSRFVFLFQSG
ncbi:MAG: Z1 domain-containing protein [Pseudomonadota bacterium]